MLVAAVDDGAPDPLDALLHRGVGQPDNNGFLEPAPRDVHLYLADDPINPIERHAMQSG